MKTVVGNLLRSKISMMPTFRGPAYLSERDGPKIGYGDEVIALEVVENLDGVWVKVLCLETKAVGWIQREMLEVIV